MGFDRAQAYQRFMGIYSGPLAERFVALLDLRPGQRALDVGCGPGALTEHLVSALGADHVLAADPSPAFVAAAQERLPGVDVRRAGAEALPWADAAVDVSAAQLVVHFMSDPVAGLAEMARVTRPGGVVAAAVWDYAGGRAPLSAFWSAARRVHGSIEDESGLAGVREGHLAELFAAAGLIDLRPDELTIEVAFEGFEQWWQPYTLGVGPAGDYVRALSATDEARLREQCRDEVGDGPFSIRATAWAVVGRVAG